MPYSVKLWRGKHWRIWLITVNSPNFTLQIFVVQKLINVYVYMTGHTFEVFKMSIWKYFCPISKPVNKELPDLNGSLSIQLPSSTVVKANALVSPTTKKQSSKERGPYLILTPA